jgi:hypothetical protein
MIRAVPGTAAWDWRTIPIAIGQNNLKNGARLSLSLIIIDTGRVFPVNVLKLVISARVLIKIYLFLPN